MQEDINDIIKQNEGLVYKQLHKFHLIDDPDANSFAFEALYKAIESYNESVGVKLSTYASVCIYNTLGDYIRKLNKKCVVKTVSYNNLSDIELEYESMLSTQESTEDVVLERMAVNNIYRVLEELQSTYTGNRLKVFNLWLQTEFTCTATKLAEELKVSQPYVSTILAQIRKDIKKKLEEN